MTREQLKALGLTDEQIDSVMAEHGKVFNPVKQDLDTVTTERDTLSKELKTRDQQITDLEASAGDNEQLKQDLKDLKDKNESFKSDYQKELEAVKLDYEMDQALILNKARNPKAVRALLDKETVKFDESGKLIGLSEQLENLKESDSYLFASDEPATPPPAPTHTPGANQKTNTPKDIDPYEAGRLKAMERHKKEEE